MRLLCWLFEGSGLLCSRSLPPLAGAGSLSTSPACYCAGFAVEIRVASARTAGTALIGIMTIRYV